MSIDRKKASNQDLLRWLIADTVTAERFGWSTRRGRTIELHIKELMRRLEPDTELTDGQLNDMVLG